MRPNARCVTRSWPKNSACARRKSWPNRCSIKPTSQTHTKFVIWRARYTSKAWPRASGAAWAPRWISNARAKKGRITIEFYSDAELEGLIQRLKMIQLMHLLIDGYNLIHATPEFASAHAKRPGPAVLTLALKLYRQYKSHKITVVLDGGPQPQESQASLNRVPMIYSGQEQSADDVIARLGRTPPSWCHRDQR
jgi:hypothetical protein